jgi:hypothetical protein
MVYKNGAEPGVGTPPMNPNNSGRDRSLICVCVMRTGDHDWNALAQEAAYYHEHGQSHPTDDPDFDAPDMSLPLSDLWRVSIVPSYGGEPTEVIVQAWDGLAYQTMRTFTGDDAMADAHALVNRMLIAEARAARYAETERGI